MKNELNRMKEELSNKDKLINKLTIDYSTKEVDFSTQIDDLHKKIKDENKNYLDLLNKHEVLEKEFSELVSYKIEKLISLFIIHSLFFILYS